MQPILQKGHSSVVLPILAVFAILLTVVTVYFWQSFEKEKAVNELLKGKGVVVSDGAATKLFEETSSQAESTPSTKLPVIVYTPSGLFSSIEMYELEKKMIAPFVDWHKDIGINVVSINIEKPSPAISNYTYKITYINEGGSNGGFLFGTQKPLEWWLPECMPPTGCVFSQQFKNKYPEIVQKF